jgi:hypothetical protein
VTSTAPTASVRLRPDQIVRTAKAPIMTPAGTNFVPSHGRAPSNTKQSAASIHLTRVHNLTASSAAAASAAAAASSGYTAVA